MSSTIDYGNLMHRAMRGLVRDVLTDVQTNGLPGNHHFFVTFDTQHEGVDIAGWLKERYPDEMTVVMQHEFSDLIVDEDGFRVTMSFGDQPEVLVIPFAAIRTFVDPSVEFGLRFEAPETEDDSDPLPVLEEVSDDDPAIIEDETRGDADVVSLDSFRK